MHKIYPCKFVGYLVECRIPGFGHLEGSKIVMTSISFLNIYNSGFLFQKKKEEEDEVRKRFEDLKLKLRNTNLVTTKWTNLGLR